MGTTVTVTTKINRTYLKNKTKDEIIDLLLYILDTRCEADAKIEKQAAEIERLRAVLAEYADRENWIRSLVAPNTLSEKFDLWLPIEHGYTRAEECLREDNNE